MAGLKVGFIGLGTMGAPMARNLISTGFDVTVHNRTRSKEDGFPSRAASPKEAARDADVVVTIVSDTPDVEHVLFGADGVSSGVREGAVVVDMSTISPDATKRFAERLAAQGVGYVDAPVSGGSEGAERGTLTIMCGGEKAHIERVRPVLEAMGSKVTHVGGSGHGQLTKAVNQIIIAGYFLALAEGITFGLKAGLDMGKVIDAISAGMCRSAVLEMRASNMLHDTYPLGFKLSLHHKDLGIALETAGSAGVELPLAELVSGIERSLLDEHGDDDLSVVAKAIRRSAGV